MGMKCIECNRTKGKRICPLKADALICPRCCATIRGLECLGCSHFESAMVYAAQNRSGGQGFPHIERNLETEHAIDIALDMLENEQLVEAETLMNDLYARDPDSYLVLYVMGTLLSMQGRPDEGIRFLKQSIEKFPYFAEAHFNLGVNFKNLFDMSNTFKSMRRVVELANPDQDIHGQAKSILKAIAESVRRNDQVDMDTYLDTRDVFEEAVEFMQAKRWSLAIGRFEDVLKVLDSHVQSLGNLGICHAGQGEITRAIEYLDKALAIDPDYDLAASNKVHIEHLAPGEKLDGDISVTDFYQDRMLGQYKKGSALLSQRQDAAERALRLAAGENRDGDG